MLLAFDVGNTTVLVGIRAAGDPGWIETWRFSTSRERTWEEWHALLWPYLFGGPGGPLEITDIAISSVVPSVGTSLLNWSRRFMAIEPLVMSVALDLPIRVETLQPAETGVDRVANAVAGWTRFGGPLVIADLGTATKVDAVTADGIFLGGSIAPGIGLGMEALASRAARLYAVPLRVPEQTIGRDTISAVQSGVVIGHIATVEGLIARTQRELGATGPVVLTGGYAEVIADAIDIQGEIHREPLLTLDGIAETWSRNRDRAAHS